MAFSLGDDRAGVVPGIALILEGGEEALLLLRLGIALDGLVHQVCGEFFEPGVGEKPNV